MTTVTVDQLSKSFGSHDVLKNVSMELQFGKVYGLVGRNGSGKSVLMKCIAGLIRPTSGSIAVQGKRIGVDVDFAPSTGIAIEQPGLLLKKSALDNLRVLQALTTRPVVSDLQELIALVGLDPNERKATGKYSMGMKQRLSIAMALLGDPQLLLLDEPMSNLDKTGADEMRVLFRQLADRGKTLVIATHIQEDISGLCDDVFHMDAGVMTMTKDAG